MTLSMKISSLGIALGLALCGCGKDTVEPHQELRPVRVITVSGGNASLDANYSGEIRARYESNLGFKVAGRVAERLVEVGSHVVPGQPLLRLDPQDAALSAASAQAQTEAARIKLAQTQIDLERFQRLFEQRFISKSALDQYKLAYDTAASQLRATQAEQQMSLNQRAYTVLSAQRAGVVTAIDVEVGQVVSVGQPVLSLAADGEREVLVSVPESRVEELRNAERMTVTTWANPQKLYAATLRELAPDTDKQTRTYAARVTIQQPDNAIRLGMTASVQIKGRAGASAVRVPLAAIYDKTGQPQVWVVDTKTSTVAIRPVQLAAAHKDSVLIGAGLKEGEVIVTAGVHMLHPSQKVKVMQPEVVLGSMQ